MRFPPVESAPLVTTRFTLSLKYGCSGVRSIPFRSRFRFAYRGSMLTVPFADRTPVLFNVRRSEAFPRLFLAVEKFSADRLTGSAMNVVGSGAARSSTFTAYRSSASFVRTTNQGVAGGAGGGGGAPFSAGGMGATRLERFITPLLSRRIATVPFWVESSPTVTVRLMRSMLVFF